MTKSGSLIFFPLFHLSYIIWLSKQNLFYLNLSCWERYFNNQTVLGSVVWLVSILNICHLATLFVVGCTKMPWQQWPLDCECREFLDLHLLQKQKMTRGQFPSGFEHCIQQMQSLNGVGHKFISTVCCIGLYFVSCPKITIYHCVTHVREISQSVYCICKDQDFESVARLNWISEIRYFATYLQSVVREITC